MTLLGAPIQVTGDAMQRLSLEGTRIDYLI